MLTNEFAFVELFAASEVRGAPTATVRTAGRGRSAVGASDLQKKKICVLLQFVSCVA